VKAPEPAAFEPRRKMTKITSSAPHKEKNAVALFPSSSNQHDAHARPNMLTRLSSGCYHIRMRERQDNSTIVKYCRMAECEGRKHCQGD
jgi:hypothetical protein